MDSRSLSFGVHDEEEDVCRICRTSGDNSNPLYFPCACSGSIKYVHQDCLMQWLNHSNKRSCEVCKHPFSFSPVYAENTPTHLPLTELLLGAAHKVALFLHFLLRLALVLTVWLALIPFTTCWLWRLTFVRSFSHASSLLHSRLTPLLLLTDCVYGSFLSATIVVVFLGATSLREYFRTHLNQEAEEEDHPIPPPDNIRVRIVGEEGGREVVAEGGDDAAAAAADVDARGLVVALGAEDDGMFDLPEEIDGGDDLPFNELVGMQGPLLMLVENAITVMASNAIFLAMALLLPFTVGRMAITACLSFFKTAPGTTFLRTLFSAWLALNTLLVPTAFSPSNVPQEASRTLHFTGNSSPVASLADTVLGNLWNVPEPALGNISLSSLASGGQNGIFAGALTTEKKVDFLAGQWAAKERLREGMEAFVASMDSLSDAATVAVGYAAMVVLLLAYVTSVLFFRFLRREPVLGRRGGARSAFLDAAPSMLRQFVAGARYLGVLTKVTLLLFVELGIFPLLCGWWLDICTMSLLNASLASRGAFLKAAPVSCSLLHWLVGIVYMLHVSIFISILREVLKPGVLYFLRDPADPNYNPFRDLVDEPVHKHARRVFVSLLIYANLIVLLVYVPVRAALAVVPSLFPLNLRFSDPFTEIPADMLLFHVCLPFTVEHFHPKTAVKRVLAFWFSVGCKVLRLSKVLLPDPEEAQAAGEARNNRDQDNVRGREAVRLEAVPEDGEGAEEVKLRGDEQRDMQGRERSRSVAARVAVLVFSAWATLVLFNSASILLPVTIGRWVFRNVSKLPFTHGAQCNDIYAFGIGCYVLWGSIAGLRYTGKFLRTNNAKVLFLHVLKWTQIIIKSSVLFFLWLGLIPVLVGLLFELLVVVPLRVPINESPVFLLYQDWALGLLFLKIWTRLVMMGQANFIADEGWRVKFERVKNDGFARLNAFWVLQAIVGPVVVNLLTALCVPFVLARGIFPLLGFSLVVNSAVYRYAWLLSGCTIAVVKSLERAQKWYDDLHNTIRDERYLVGKRLHNFVGEQAK